MTKLQLRGKTKCVSQTLYQSLQTTNMNFEQVTPQLQSVSIFIDMFAPKWARGPHNLARFPSWDPVFKCFANIRITFQIAFL